MRIRTFSKYIEAHAHDYSLKDATVVVDGNNFFYKIYSIRGFPYEFGCECDRYADHLRNYLDMFKKANVRCYFIFKGGCPDSNSFDERNLQRREFSFRNKKYEWSRTMIVQPIFTRQVCQQVLEEMGFDYTMCLFDSKVECVALAQKLKCPILGFDIELAFYDVQYIPYQTLLFESVTSTIRCGLFNLDIFLNDHNLTKEKIALFAAMTDVTIFPDDFFMPIIKTLDIPIGNFKRNIGILKWLARTDNNQALSLISKYLNKDDQTKLQDAEKKVNEMMMRQETPGLPTEYLENGNAIEVANKDPMWFEKGVVTKRISPTYISLYRWNVVNGSWAIGDVEADDPMQLSIEIIQYAFNLLTNFQKVMIFRSGSKSIHITVEGSVRKPNYEAVVSVFENGWNRVRSLQLVDHFLDEALQGLDFGALDYLPEDVRLLMISLVYFSRKKPADTSAEVSSVLLSYVALSLLAGVNEIDNSKVDMSKKPVPNSTTNMETITEKDRISAGVLLKEYFQSDSEQTKMILDPQLVHPLVEFQHCLDHMNQLNILCGAPYKPTVYSKTFNGTFVYKILYSIKKYFSGDCPEFFKVKMSAAPTVLAFLNGLIEVYEKICLEHRI